MSPTQRSLAKWRNAGWTVAIVEKYIAAIRQRKDLFGLFDLLALKDDALVGIQTTSGAHHADHLEKMKANPMLSKWRSHYTRMAVCESWSKKGPRGKRKVWECREEWL